MISCLITLSNSLNLTRYQLSFNAIDKQALLGNTWGTVGYHASRRPTGHVALPYECISIMNQAMD